MNCDSQTWLTIPPFSRARGRFSLLTIAIFCCVCVGCKRPRLPALLEQGDASWGINQDEGVPGVDYGSMQYIWRQNGELQAVVWVDFTGASGNGSGLSVHHGHFSDGKQRKVAWSCSVAQRVLGEMEVAGQTYDLKNGAIFLVSSTGEGYEVEQVEADMSKIRPEPQAIRKLAEAERFFRAVAKNP